MTRALQCAVWVATAWAAAESVRADASLLPLAMLDDAWDASHEAPQASKEAHLVWDLNWERATQPEVLVCSVILFTLGIACAAGGVGGGGVFVVVLMMAGKLTPYDAVPLSKATVFTGSIATLLLNIRRWRVAEDCVIDLNTCRMVVPSAIVGTFLGVLLNRYSHDGLILSILVIMLMVMAVFVFSTAWRQFRDELQGQQEFEAGAGTADGGSHPDNCHAEAEVCQPWLPPPAGTNMPTWSDVAISFCLLVTGVLSGVLHFHMDACREEKVSGAQGACAHPILQTLFRGQMGVWMKDPQIATVLQLAALSLPVWSWAVTMPFYGHYVCQKGGWNMTQVLGCQALGVATGLIAGLVGIGGGLILSPAFLLVGMDPSIAVGTSSTCVLFTSSSTTLQYALTDRVVASLALVYGLVTAASSACGTHLVHHLREWCPYRKSYISFLVASTVLAKLLQTAL